MQLLGQIRKHYVIVIAVLNALNVAMQYVKGNMLSCHLNYWPKIHVKSQKNVWCPAIIVSSGHIAKPVKPHYI